VLWVQTCLQIRPGTPANRVDIDGSFLTGDPVGGLHPSDHFPVVADVRV